MLLLPLAVISAADEDLPPWGIAVYMMPSDMIPEARKDFDEMVAIAAAHDIPIAVQWLTFHSDTGERRVRRALLSGDEEWYSSGTVLPGISTMAERAVFADFLSWVQEVSPSQRRALVTWGHGGLERGLGYDGSGLDVNYFTFDRMRDGAADAGYSCDLLVACGCKSAVAEGAIRYADFAQHFTGTALDKIKLSSGLGPFDTWLADLVANPDWDGPRVGQSWVERYQASTGSYGNTAIVMDLQDFIRPYGALDQAAWAAAALQRLHSVETLRPILSGIHANFQTSAGYTVLDDWLIALANPENGLDAQIHSRATQARTLMEDSISYRWHGASNANGLGFYTPYVEHPPTSAPIPPESEYLILDRASFLATWTRDMPFINVHAYAYGDGTQQPNTLLPRIIEHHFDEDSGTLTLRFNQPMVRSSFDRSQDAHLSGPGGSISADTWQGLDTLILSVAELQPGTHTLSIGPDIWDTHGVGMDQNSNGVAEETEDAYIVTLTIDGGDPPPPQITVPAQVDPDTLLINP